MQTARMADLVWIEQGLSAFVHRSSPVPTVRQVKLWNTILIFVTVV